MSTSSENFSLTVRLGRCQRYTETDGTFVRRTIELLYCPILNGDLKGEGQPAPGDEINLWILETDQGQEVIGSFDAPTILYLSLPPAAFAEFWAASSAADGAARDITIQFKSDETKFFRITKAQLIEHMPEAIDFNPKAHKAGYIHGRAHPVVTELRDMQRRLAGSWRGVVTGLSAVAAIVLVIDLLGAAFRALWRLVQQ